MVESDDLTCTKEGHLCRAGADFDREVAKHVYLAGTISELARRRAEFASTMRHQGFEGLIALLKRKSEELARS
jgi:hypothetical protein